MNSAQSGGPLYKRLYELLRDAGLSVNSTAGYPRVEISSVSEGEPVSKDGSVRTAQAVIDSLSSLSFGESADMDNEVNVAVGNAEWPVAVDDAPIPFEIFGATTMSCVVGEDYTDSQEHLYRYTRTIQFYLQDKQLKEDNNG